MPRQKKQVVVIGAGVIGLTTALRLQEGGHNVRIIAKDFPAPFETIDPKSQINYTSPWAGAKSGWGTGLPEKDAPPESWRDHQFTLKTFARMEELQAAYPEAGIAFSEAIEYFEDPPANIRKLTQETAEELGIQEFKRLPEDQLPRGVVFGYSYRSWSLNPMVYCCFLLRRFTLNGGKILKREIRDPGEIFALAEFEDNDFVVNASGIGFGDDKIFITRGQTCLVANDTNKMITRRNADGTASFCIPRNFSGGTIIGGTFEPNNWDPEPTPGLRDRLLRDLTETYPAILGANGKLVPLADIVGRRPTREGGMRLEKQVVGGSKVIVHAYGMGGSGYELSWGVADAVGEMVSGPSPTYKVALATSNVFIEL